MLRYETDTSFLSISEIQKLEAKSGTIESEKLLSLLFPKFSFKVESKNIYPSTMLLGLPCFYFLNVVISSYQPYLLDEPTHRIVRWLVSPTLQLLPLKFCFLYVLSLQF